MTTRYWQVVKFRLISEDSLERLQAHLQLDILQDVVPESSDSESDEEADGEDNDGVDHQAPSGVTIARTPFKVNPSNMGLKSAGLCPKQTASSRWMKV